ncbi:MAG: radical SAM protein, partial [Mogibacterium sp.]|nr:radical SAM protein [Mogibacterium sp.]
MIDRYGRKIEYMRISITDRCNLRCRYCMPDGIEKVSMDRILTYEDFLRICRAAVNLGITRFKVTGGEPLVRLGCPEFISSLKKIPGVEQVTLTTNGIALEQYIDELADAGLDAVNVSLDTMDSDKFRYITQCGDITAVMRGIEAAAEKGIRTKINCVPQKGFNDGEISDFAEFAFAKGIDVRFIELMPLGPGRDCPRLPEEELLSRLLPATGPLTPYAGRLGNG